MNLENKVAFRFQPKAAWGYPQLQAKYPRSTIVDPKPRV